MTQTLAQSDERAELFATSPHPNTHKNNILIDSKTPIHQLQHSQTDTRMRMFRSFYVDILPIEVGIASIGMFGGIY